MFLPKSTFWVDFWNIFYTYSENHEGGLIQPPPYPNEYLYSISIQRPIHHFITYKMVTNIWKFQPCSSNGFFLRPEKPKSWNFLELPRSFTIRKYFFFKLGEIVPKMLGWCCKVFQTIRNCQEIGFNVKFVILGQELGIWQREGWFSPQPNRHFLD